MNQNNLTASALAGYSQTLSQANAGNQRVNGYKHSKYSEQTLEKTFENILKILEPEIIIDEPLPCPLCGKLPEIVEQREDSGCCAEETLVKISCEDCNLEMSDDWINDHYVRNQNAGTRLTFRKNYLRNIQNSKKKLVEKWNRRFL